MCKIARSCVFFAMLLSSMGANALETKFSGFGSVGGGMLSNDKLEYLVAGAK